MELLSRGMTVMESLHAIGYKGDSTYARWRRDSENFKRKADSIIAMRTEMPGGSLVHLDDRRLQAFLKIYREQGNRNAALVAADVSAILIEALLDEDGPEYDEAFAIRYRDAELRHLWEVEDHTVGDAKANTGTTSRFILQTRMPDRYNKPLLASMRTNGDSALQRQQNVFFFQIGENERTAEEILGNIFEKFSSPLEIGAEHGSDNVSNQEARADIPGVVVCDSVG